MKETLATQLPQYDWRVDAMLGLYLEFVNLYGDVYWFIPNDWRSAEQHSASIEAVKSHMKKFVRTMPTVETGSIIVKPGGLQ